MIIPFRKPTAIAIITAISNVIHMFMCVSLCSNARTIQESPVIAPPLISIPPVIMIMVCAAAITPMIAHCFIKFVTL